MPDQSKKIAQSSPGSETIQTLSIAGIAGEVGWKLVIPLLFFMLIGIEIDQRLHTTPLFIIIGLLLAATTSAYLIYAMIRRVNTLLKSKTQDTKDTK